MAILSMEKVTLIAHADSKQRLLKSLQQLGAVEVLTSSVEGLPLAAAPDSLARLEGRLAEVREAMETIRPYDDTKTSFLTPKPPITLTELEDMPSRLAEADGLIAKIKRFSDDMGALKARRQRLRNRIAALTPYASFDAPMESVGPGRYTVSLLGTIPADSAEKYDQIREDYADTAYFEDLGGGHDLKSLYVVMLSSVQEALVGELKYLGLAEAYTKELYGTPSDIISDAENECASLETEAREYEDIARGLAAQKAVLKALEDYLLCEIAREKCFERLSETGMAFLLEGWVIGDDKEKVQAVVLEAAPEAYVEFRPPLDDEKPPTALHNPHLVTPFEAVTNMYAVPSPRGFDPNLLMSIFYFIIFGMMIGDAAYGAILSIGAFAILKLKKPTGMFRMITTVFMICGFSTIFWGLFYGTVFSINGIPAVINPLNGDGAMTTLIMCLGIGVLHIITGLGIGMYMDIKRGHFWAAIFDRFSWIMVIIGGIMLLVGNPVGQAGQYIALAGALILLFTQGRSKKGVVRKVTGGLASLYGVTSYVSDILSYARIFGMGLATTVIAMVFNTIAGLLMGGVVGYIFGLVVLTVGHVFNIAINALGAFVHTARLQYIEFFNKFYEADGHAFSPLRFSVKNHRLES
jgi:V/A-type H+-transporting ATPase subunit I